ncbi:MAG TPA: hypothetical protein V6D05_17875 [Stenomitos sp.]
MHKDEAAARGAITTYARQNLKTGKVLDVHFDEARGAWIGSAIGKAGVIEVVAKAEGSRFSVSHAAPMGRPHAGANARSHVHVKNESAAAFLLRGVVFAAVAVALAAGYMVGKPQLEKLLHEAKQAGDVKPTGKSELGGALGGNSAMLDAAERLSKDPKANAAVNKFIQQNAGGAASKLETLQRLNGTGQ